jgi:uncharacterized LabA/DUF88 family protein
MEETTPIQPTKQARVALFLDAENFAYVAGRAGRDVYLKVLIDLVREQGLLVYSRAYADWTNHRMVPLMRQLHEYGVLMEQLCTSFQGKNTADMQLATDALEMCLSADAPTVLVIASGDRDMVPLIHKLRRRAVKVVGIGFENSVGQTIRNVCDEFYFYEALVPSQGEFAEDEERPIDTKAATELLDRAVSILEGDGRALTGSNLNKTMKQLDPGFDYRGLGFESFRKFLESEEGAQIVKLAGFAGLDLKFERVNGKPEAPKVAAVKTLPTTPQEAARLYANTLHDRGVNVIEQPYREMLVSALLRRLNLSGEEGMSLQEMNAEVQFEAQKLGLGHDSRTLSKIAHTMNIGRCFGRDNYAAYERDMTVPLFPMVANVQEAMARMDAVYVGGLLRSDVEPAATGVAVWLYGNDEPNEVTRAERAIRAARDAFAYSNA